MLHFKNHFQSDVHRTTKKTKRHSLPHPSSKKKKKKKFAWIVSLSYEDRECEVVRP